MALYVSLSLLAVIVALPTGTSDAGRGPQAFALLSTSVGLALAHQLAFRLSARLVEKGEFSQANGEVLAAQLTGGAAVTAIAVLPVLVLPVLVLGAQLGRPVSELLLLGFVSLVGYGAARSVPLSRTRALVYVAVVWLLTLGVLAVKNLAGH